MFQFRNSGAFENAVYHHNSQNNITAALTKKKKKQSRNIIVTNLLSCANFYYYQFRCYHFNDFLTKNQKKKQKKQTATSFLCYDFAFLFKKLKSLHK